MDEDYDDNIEVIEPGDSDYYKKEENFSHPALVMLSYRRSLEALAKELRKGYWETKVDKFGNVNQSYNPDTRLDFINSVEALRIVLVSDYDSEAQKQVKDFLALLEKKKEELATQEHRWYTLQPPNKRVLIAHAPGYLNQELAFYQIYIEEQVKIYKEILIVLELLLKRSHYLKKEMVIA